jgi:hypothetical protein
MSTWRLTGTAAAMGVIAAVLSALTPGIAAMAAVLADAQQTADRLGPDTLVVAAAGLLAWAVWAWGALGLALTAASAIPGLLGLGARQILRVLLPTGARRAAALALGLGVGVAAPLLVPATTFGTPVASAAVTPAGPAVVPDWPPASDPGEGPGEGTVPDWPVGPQPRSPVPDWSPEPPSGAHVVVRGDCLWQIAAAQLRDTGHPAPTDAETATAVHAWWTANASVIGPDPDLLLPGQVLRQPGPP